MKKEKGFLENEHYFTKNETLKWIGIILIVLSGVCYFFGWGFVSYIIMSIGLPLGAILCVIGSFGRSSESYIDEYIKRRIDEKFEMVPEDDRHFTKRQLKRIEPMDFRGMVYRDGVMLRRSKNGMVRSSEYGRTVIYPLDTAIFVCFRKISVVCDEHIEDAIEIPYTDIAEFKLLKESRTISFNEKPFKVTATELYIEYDGGKIFSMPMQDNIKTDAYIEKINEQINKAKG